MNIYVGNSIPIMSPIMYVCMYVNSASLNAIYAVCVGLNVIKSHFKAHGCSWLGFPHILNAILC